MEGEGSAERTDSWAEHEGPRTCFVLLKFNLFNFKRSGGTQLTSLFSSILDSSSRRPSDESKTTRRRFPRIRVGIVLQAIMSMERISSVKERCFCSGRGDK